MELRGDREGLGLWSTTTKRNHFRCYRLGVGVGGSWRVRLWLFSVVQMSQARKDSGGWAKMRSRSLGECG